MLSKSLRLTHNPDAVVFDLEDSVPLVYKDKIAAREMVSRFIAGEWRQERQRRRRDSDENEKDLPLLIPRINATKDLIGDDIAVICSSDQVHVCIRVGVYPIIIDTFAMINHDHHPGHHSWQSGLC